MAFPILLLSYSPALFRFLPKPGPWMETFKQFMAFPLYASALFFLWVLGNQVGVMGMSMYTCTVSCGVPASALHSSSGRRSQHVAVSSLIRGSAVFTL